MCVDMSMGSIEGVIEIIPMIDMYGVRGSTEAVPEDMTVTMM